MSTQGASNHHTYQEPSLPRRHPVDLLVLLLLVVGFFLGPLKLLGISWVTYLLADGLALLVLIVVFGQRVASRRPVIGASPLSVALCILGALCVLELANPEAPFVRSVLGLRSWLLYLGFYFVGFYTLRSVEQLGRLYGVLLTLGFVTGAYGIYQWQVGPEFFANWSDYYGRYAQLAWTASSGDVFRAFSTFVGAGTFGANMALLMLIALGVLVSRSVRSQWRILAAVSFLVMAVGLAASGSRAPVVQLLLAAAVGIGFMRRGSRRLSVGVTTLVAVGAAVTLIVFSVGPVVSERFASIFDPQAFFWKWFSPLSNGIGFALGHFFGMGLGFTAGVPVFINQPAFQDLPVTNIDSGYGSAAAELGLIGLCVFTYLAVKVGIEGLRAWKRLPPGELQDLLLGPALMATTYPLVSVIYQPQAQLPNSIYLWLLIGMLMKGPNLKRQADADQLLRSQVHTGEQPR